MPVRPDPEAATGLGRVLAAGDGTTLARFVYDERDGRDFADLFLAADGVEADRLVAAIAAELGGWTVSAEEALAERLLAHGGMRDRHAHVMTRDLRGGVPAEWGAGVPAGYRIGPVDRPPADLAAACHAAYPPEHPDHRPSEDLAGAAGELERLMTGQILGPMLDCSRIAVDAQTGDVVGAALVSDESGEPPYGGPWLFELFRAPGHRGVGAALLRHALHEAAAAGCATMGLAVTVTNPAHRLYERHGFRVVSTSVNVRMP